MRLHLLAIVFVLVCGPAGAASAGSGALDTGDADLVPDSFDNCDVVPNGPNDASNQVDTDLDGYGNACDADYDNDFGVSASDFGILIGAIGGPSPLVDHDGDESVTVGDFSVFLGQFGGVPGTSGLSCAGIVPCTP